VRREDWDTRYAETGLLWSRDPNRFLVAEAADLSPGRALDLACGEGRNAIWLAERGWRVTAVDFSEVAIAKARERAAQDGSEVDFHCLDLLDYEPEPGSYDLVLVLYLQLPAAERRLVLGRAASALAPGGNFLLVGHDLVNLTEGVGGPSDPNVLGGFNRSSQRSTKRSCDEREEAEVGSGWSADDAVAGASAGRASGAPSAVLGGDRSRRFERGRGR
jgi:SAM-dependent methyltransferase